MGARAHAKLGAPGAQMTQQIIWPIGTQNNMAHDQSEPPNKDCFSAAIWQLNEWQESGKNCEHFQLISVNHQKG